MDEPGALLSAYLDKRQIFLWQALWTNKHSKCSFPEESEQFYKGLVSPGLFFPIRAWLEMRVASKLKGLCLCPHQATTCLILLLTDAQLTPGWWSNGVKPPSHPRGHKIYPFGWLIGYLKKRFNGFSLWEWDEKLFTSLPVSEKKGK